MNSSRRPIIKALMWPFVVVQIEIIAQACKQRRGRFIAFDVNVLMLHGTPQPLHEDVVKDAATAVQLTGGDLGMDQVLAALYETAAEGGPAERQAGLGASAPRVARWLGDTRRYFPAPVVQVMQKDAIERLNLHHLLLEPEMLAAVQPDVHLVATLLTLKGAIPEVTKTTARLVVQRVVDDLMRRLANTTRRAVQGSLNRAARTTMILIGRRRSGVI